MGEVSGEGFIEQLNNAFAAIKTKAAEAERLRAENVKARELLAVATNEIKALTQREGEATRLNAELEGALRDRDARLEALSRENRALGENQSEEMRALRGRLEDMEQQLEHALGQKDGAEARVKKLEKGVSHHRATRDELARRVAELEDALEGQKAKAADAIKQANDRVSGVEREKAELNKHMMNLMEELRTCERRSIALEKESAGTQARIEEAKAARNSVGIELAAMQKKLRVLEDAHTEMVREVEVLRSYKTTAVSEIDSLETRVKRAEGAEATLKGENEEQARAILALRNDLSASKNGNHGRLEKLNSEIKHLKAELESAKEDAARGQEAVGDMRVMQEQMARMGSDMQKAILEAEASKQRMTTSDERLEQIKEKLSKRTEEMSSTIGKLRSELAEVGQRAEKAEHNLENLSKHASALTGNQDKKDAEIEHLREELENMSKSTHVRTAALAEKVSQLQGQLDAANSARHAAELALRKGAQQAREKEEAMSLAATTEITNLRNEVHGLRRVASEHEGHLSAVRNDAEAAKSAAKKWQDANSALEEVLSKKKDECDDLQRELRNLRGDGESYQERLNTAIQKREEAEANLAEAERKLLNSREEMLKLQREAAQAQSERDAIRSDFEKLQAEMEAMNASTAMQITAFGDRADGLQGDLAAARDESDGLREALERQKGEAVRAAMEISSLRENLMELQEKEGRASHAAAQAHRELDALRRGMEEDSNFAQRDRSALSHQLQMEKDSLRQARLDAAEFERELQVSREQLRNMSRRLQQLERDNEALRKIETGLKGYYRGVVTNSSMSTRPPGTGMTRPPGTSYGAPALSPSVEPPPLPSPMQGALPVLPTPKSSTAKEGFSGPMRSGSGGQRRAEARAMAMEALEAADKLRASSDSAVHASDDGRGRSSGGGVMRGSDAAASWGGAGAAPGSFTKHIEQARKGIRQPEPEPEHGYAHAQARSNHDGGSAGPSGSDETSHLIARTAEFLQRHDRTADRDRDRDRDRRGRASGPPMGGAPLGGAPLGGAPLGGAPLGGAPVNSGRSKTPAEDSMYPVGGLPRSESGSALGSKTRSSRSSGSKSGSSHGKSGSSHGKSSKSKKKKSKS